MSFPSIIRGALLAAALLGSACTAMAEDVGNAPASLTLNAPTAAATATCTPVGQTDMSAPETLQRRFIDQFDGTSLSMRLWRPYYQDDAKAFTNRTLANNKEKEIYVDPAYTGKGVRALGLDPFSVKQGVLAITARRTPPEQAAALYGMPFTSGVITTMGSFTQTYGYFEISAKLPRGKGLWPAFWLLQPHRWPPEIDVMEAFDGLHPDNVTMTTHWNEDQQHKMSLCSGVAAQADQRFHTYGVWWTKERIVYYIDRQPVGQMLTPPELTQPMYMLVNLAVESIADQTTPDAAAYAIDWVAAWQ